MSYVGGNFSKNATAGADVSGGQREVTCKLTTLSDLLQEFWRLEEITGEEGLSASEAQCERHFRETVSRDTTGRYVVRLPFKLEPYLGISRRMALRRFRALERKFNTNAQLKIEYSKVMDEFIELVHMSLVHNECTSDSDSFGGYYMPHHAVIKQSSVTTKVRVVFDASAKSDNGSSLNDQLLIGPTIQDKVFAHLTRCTSSC